jgi:hypothetical protein
MRDYAVSSNERYSSYFRLMLKSLSEIKDSLNINISAKKIGGRYYALISCPAEAFNSVMALASDILKDIILINYKYLYFKNTLNIKIRDKSLESLFYTSITLYDRDYDCELVDFNHICDKELTIDGIFNFCLADLISRWDTVAEILKDNFYGDCDRQAIYEFVKHIIYTLPNKLSEVNIYKHEDFYVFLDSNGKNIDKFISVNGGELASKIMFVNPALINFYHCCDKQTMTFLKTIFNERIKFYS